MSNSCSENHFRIIRDSLKDFFEIKRVCVWACHETVNRFTEPTEPGCRGNLAKKRGREVPETGRDRYKAEEEVGVVEVVVLSCSVNREKGKGSKKHWKSRLLPHIEVVESRGLLGRCQHQSQMCSARVCVCVWDWVNVYESVWVTWIWRCCVCE